MNYTTRVFKMYVVNFRKSTDFLYLGPLMLPVMSWKFLLLHLCILGEEIWRKKSDSYFFFIENIIKEQHSRLKHTKTLQTSLQDVEVFIYRFRSVKLGWLSELNFPLDWS